MKAFVRKYVAVPVVIIVATLLITSLAGGSETVFYVASYVSLALGLCWEAWKGRLS
jgi:hypothetical protein